IEQTAGQLQLLGGADRQRGDEIDRLTFTFKQLVERIQTQIEKLREADTLRRELVTNVSHDLRTPLATLQGYIETLFLKDKNLTAEDRGGIGVVGHQARYQRLHADLNRVLERLRINGHLKCLGVTVARRRERR
ncbi:MAG: hypothetical protein HQ515_26030, partial [Phycisphaeraceae bacterium]|nr:hypothetical protein [Phycisphaeraceae bacterium]